MKYFNTTKKNMTLTQKFNYIKNHFTYFTLNSWNGLTSIAHQNKMKKLTYKQLKEKARQLAVDWQIEFSENDHYMSEYAYWGDKFTKLAKRYGLIKEFRENGII